MLNVYDASTEKTRCIYEQTGGFRLVQGEANPMQEDDENNG
jgi:hypothetical protein